MADFVFTSPGVKFKERDLTFVTRNVGITTLGLVGETLKGPAFEPIFIQDKTQFANRFGAQSIARFSANGNLQYQLPYAANLYLEESNQLYVTRVLGLSGYDAGSAWAITLSAGVDPATETGTTVITGITGFTGGAFLGVTLTATGQTGSTFIGYHKISGTSNFSGYSYTFTCITYVPTGLSGTVKYTRTLMTGATGVYGKYENMVLAILRSRGYVQDNVNATPTTVFDINTLTITSNNTIVGSGDLFGQFTLLAASGATNESYTATLNPNSSSFLPNVVGSDAKDKNTKIWVEAIYPDLIELLDAEGIGYGINTILIKCVTPIYTNRRQQFQTPETPWVVSQLKGSVMDRLFKFISISDGNAANQEIKISIANINPITLEFDVVVRDFYDTDDSPNVLETFSRCSLIQGQTNYIAQRIGTTDGTYTLQSNYIMVELADNISPDLFPAGFEGYIFNNYSTAITGGATSGRTPSIFYKTSYNSNEKVKKTYLGVSEKGYSTATLIGTGINQNFFNYDGYVNGDSTTGFTKTKGFHMDSGATGTYYEGTTYIGQFEVGTGEFQTVNDVVDPLNPYYDIATRKFTLVPSGGFDGWDVNRGYRSYGDLFTQQGIYRGSANPLQQAMNDFQAWETAINTFANPEEVTINLFATPGIDWSDQTVLVQDTIEMIETQRTDSLYIIDAPDSNVPIVIGQTKNDVVAAQDIVGLLEDTDINSSYSCTYFPWIQIKDTQNNVNVYLPPTGEVAKAMAFTDNTAFPWFAPAGLNRGVTNALKSKYKLSLDARDILYAGRINPMADFADAGTAIFGQKTLQVKESALDRINVRRLLLQVKVLIANIAIRLVFEQNDQATIDQFLQKATPILDTIKRERGLTDFQIKMDSSNNTPETIDRNELYGEIFLKPTRAVEFIGITFTITPTGASFADVGA
jgi:hypothetical protein